MKVDFGQKVDFVTTHAYPETNTHTHTHTANTTQNSKIETTKKMAEFRLYEDPFRASPRGEKYLKLIEKANTYRGIAEFENCNCSRKCFRREFDRRRLQHKILECLETMLKTDGFSSIKFLAKYIFVVPPLVEPPVKKDSDDDSEDETRQPRINYKLHNHNGNICKGAFMLAYGVDER